MPLFLPRHWSAVIVTLSLGFYAHDTQAQTRFSIGPRVGLNLAKARYEDKNGALYNFQTSLIPRIEAGLIASIYRQHLALQPGVLYSQKGYVLDGGARQANGSLVGVTYFHQVHTLNYLTFPINLVYTQKRDGQGFQGFGGGYVGILLGGRATYNTFQGVVGGTGNFYQAELPIRGGDHYQTDGSHYSKRLDAGLQVGVGYQHAGGVLQIAYSVGLTNLGVDYPMNPDPYGPHYCNRVLHVSLSYLGVVNK